MSTSIQRILVIPNLSGPGFYQQNIISSTTVPVLDQTTGNPEVTAKTDATGKPVTYEQTNADGTTTSEAVMVPLTKVVALPAPTIASGTLAFTVDVPLPTTTAATNEAIATALAAFKVAHPAVWPVTPATTALA